jgi:hypothetical protein
MRLLVLICAALLCGCGKSPHQASPPVAAQATTILDQVLAKPEYSNSIVAAQQDLATDAWNDKPYRYNSSRAAREWAVASRMLAEIKPRLKQMDITNLVGSLKVFPINSFSAFDIKRVAESVYLQGNKLIMDEIKSRPASELRALRTLGNDKVMLAPGMQGMPGSLKNRLDDILHEVQKRTTIGGLTWISHKGVEQKGGRGVRKVENTELYDDTLYRPEHDRL